MRVRIDSKEINKKLGNAVKFSYGFLEGIDLEQIEFQQRLAAFATESLGKYIDSKARMHHDSLHHVYEWGATGSETGRLFELKFKSSKRVIHITSKFLPSRTLSPTATEAFVKKAEVMESGMSVTITPTNSDVLAFEVGGDMVFTRNSVYVAHPGGPEVEGSFGSAVDEFFESYFSNFMLRPFIATLGTANEYTKNFPSGVNSGGRALGLQAGKKYLKSAGGNIL